VGVAQVGVLSVRPSSPVRLSKAERHAAGVGVGDVFLEARAIGAVLGFQHHDVLAFQQRVVVDGARRVSHVSGEAHAGGMVRAVAVGILDQVVLVILLGRMEFLQRLDIGDDGAVTGLAQQLLVIVARGDGGRALLVVAVENERAILRADVVALAVLLRRVVLLEEVLEQGAGGQHRAVVAHLHHLGVVVRIALVLAAADGLVVDLDIAAVGIARDRVDDARQRRIAFLSAPEAAGAEYQGLDVIGGGHGGRTPRERPLRM
jgi:hypothetical protein